MRQQTLQDTASAYARQRLMQHRDQQEARNVEPITTFPVNSYVLVANDTSSNMSGKRKHKLLPTFTGPFQVLDIKDSAYTLLNLVNKRTIVRPMHLLKQFEYDATRTNPFDIALKDYADDYEVEQIINHRGQWKRHSRMEFRVRWKNYPPEQDTYVPWRNLLHNEFLHQYLRQQNKAGLIPQQHR